MHFKVIVGFFAALLFTLVLSVFLVLVLEIMGVPAGIFINIPSAILTVGFALSFQLTASGYDGLIRGFGQFPLAISRAPLSPPDKEDAIFMRQLASRLYYAGAIVTLFGQIQMWCTLDDPSKLGGGTAVSLLSLLCGMLLAELLVRPTAHRVERVLRSGVQGEE